LLPPPLTAPAPAAVCLPLAQEELSTWTAAFVEKHNRKPSLVDVQRTGIPWLIERFKQYVVLRDRLFSDTSVLRGKLQESIPGGCRR
jgi:hypothetical protein